MWFHIHYLSGYFTGKLLKFKRFEMIMIILAVIMPDLDSVIYFLFSGFQNPAPFHGGVTHTLIMGLLLNILLAFIIWGLLKWRHPDTEEKFLIKLIIIGVIGIGLHLSFDLITTANEYGAIHHLYFWPFSDFSYHMDIILADIFPRWPYFDFDKLMFLQYSPHSTLLVSVLSFIINLGFFIIVFINLIPPRKSYPWEDFLYNEENKRDPWINDNLELIINLLGTIIFFGAFLIRMGYLLDVIMTIQ